MTRRYPKMASSNIQILQQQQQQQPQQQPQPQPQPQPPQPQPKPQLDWIPHTLAPRIFITFKSPKNSGVTVWSNWRFANGDCWWLWGVYVPGSQKPSKTKHATGEITTLETAPNSLMKIVSSIHNLSIGPVMRNQRYILKHHWKVSNRNTFHLSQVQVVNMGWKHRVNSMDSSGAALVAPSNHESPTSLVAAVTLEVQNW